MKLFHALLYGLAVMGLATTAWADDKKGLTSSLERYHLATKDIDASDKAALVRAGAMVKTKPSIEDVTGLASCLASLDQVQAFWRLREADRAANMEEMVAAYARATYASGGALGLKADTIDMIVEQGQEARKEAIRAMGGKMGDLPADCVKDYEKARL
ncbi:MAG: hypothetical protein WBA51_16815 [Erythrobacter sp.]